MDLPRRTKYAVTILDWRIEVRGTKHPAPMDSLEALCRVDTQKKLELVFH